MALAPAVRSRRPALAFDRSARRGRRARRAPQASLDERLSQARPDERLWPTISRLRAFRGVDTLTALALHLELGGDWHRFQQPRAARLLAWTDPVAGTSPVRAARQGAITKTGSALARRLARRGCLALQPPASDRRDTQEPPGTANPTTSSRSPDAPNGACTASTNGCAAAASHANVTAVAVARELACFLWAAATAPTYPDRHASTLGTAGRRANKPPARAIGL